ncbi:heparinase II/III-family protein [Chloroflexi bacterium TSY]|nr:heparinase II/III-family protein [Chloroflexi bacterium TSY]
MEVAAFGVPFIVAPGSYTYNTKDPYRNYFVGTYGHNTILVDGKSQIRRWYKKNLTPHVGSKQDAVWITASELDYAEATYSEGYGDFKLQRPQGTEISRDIRHTRRIVFVKPDYWIIIDSIDGGQSCVYQSLFHTAPDIEVEEWDISGVCLHSTQCDVQLLLFPSDPSAFNRRLMRGQENPIQGWFSPAKQKKQ